MWFFSFFFEFCIVFFCGARWRNELNSVLWFTIDFREKFLGPRNPKKKKGEFIDINEFLWVARLLIQLVEYETITKCIPESPTGNNGQNKKKKTPRERSMETRIYNVMLVTPCIDTVECEYGNAGHSIRSVVPQNENWFKNYSQRNRKETKIKSFSWNASVYMTEDQSLNPNWNSCQSERKWIMLCVGKIFFSILLFLIDSAMSWVDLRFCVMDTMFPLDRLLLVDLGTIALTERNKSMEPNGIIYANKKSIIYILDHYNRKANFRSFVAIQFDVCNQLTIRTKFYLVDHKSFDSQIDNEKETTKQNKIQLASYMFIVTILVRSTKRKRFTSHTGELYNEQ